MNYITNYKNSHESYILKQSDSALVRSKILSKAISEEWRLLQQQMNGFGSHMGVMLVSPHIFGLAVNLKVVFIIWHFHV